MKKTLLLFVLLFALSSAKASDTLTIRQIYNFDVGDTFDYRESLTCYCTAGAGYIPPNYCYKRYVVTSKNISTSNDTIYYNYNIHSMGTCQMFGFSPLKYSYNNLDSFLFSHLLNPIDSAYRFSDTTIHNHSANRFNTARRSSIPFGVGVPNLEEGSFIFAQNIGCYSEAIHSETGNTDPPYTPFYYYYNADLIYYSNGSERFGIPYDIASGIQEKEINFNTVDVYPNPNFGFIQVNYPDLNTKPKLILTDLLGQQVYTSIISETETTHNISSLPSGIYTWRIVSDNTIVKTGKIIKQ